MAVETPWGKLTLPAAADFTSSQYLGVTVNSSGNAALAGAGVSIVGVIQNKPDSGQAAELTCLGVTKVVLGGTVAAGDNVKTDASAKFVTASGGDVAVGVCLVGGSANQIGTVLLGSRALAASGTAGSMLSFPLILADIANGDVVTEFTPGFDGSIIATQFIVTDPVTTGSKGTTLNLEIGTTNVTGGVVTLTSANCTPKGNVVAGTAVTANNSFTSSDTVSVEASATTAFVEGEGLLVVTFQ